MKAIILAAGEGRRMRPLTLDTPKPLLRVAGKTFFEHIFEAFPDDVDEVIVVVKYLSVKIKDYLGSEFKGRRVRYVEGSERGNAFGFLACRQFISPGERFLVLYGDEIPTKDEVARVLAHPQAWLCCSMDNPKLSGIADIDEKGRIMEVIEKPENPKSHWAACGVMVIDDRVFRFTPEPHQSGEYFLTSVLNAYAGTSEIYAVKTGPCRSFTRPEDLKREGKIYESTRTEK